MKVFNFSPITIDFAQRSYNRMSSAKLSICEFHTYRTGVRSLLSISYINSHRRGYRELRIDAFFVYLTAIVW